MRVKIFFLQLFLLVFYSSQLLGKFEFCIGAIALDEIPDSGHAYVFIKNEKQIIKSYGNWPAKSSNNESIRFDYGWDRPVEPTGPHNLSLLRRYARGYSKQLKDVIQAAHCQPIHEDQIPFINKQAVSYEKEFGPWEMNGNNCVDFARYMYNRFTHDHISRHIISPTAIIGLVKNAENRKDNFLNWSIERVHFGEEKGDRRSLGNPIRAIRTWF